MSIFTTFFIAAGLAMDAFAVSIASGISMEKLRIRYALRIALFFGAFQALMPVLGFMAGLSIRDYISSFDHWIAFSLLVFIGLKMIYESLFLNGSDKKIDPDDIFMIVVLSVATSIDALAVGISLSILNVDIILPALIIGVVTFVLSYMGVYIGRNIGHLFEKKIEIIGGLVLIGIGIKILLDHL
ncbi:MAG TPA: manganese efflux pump [Deltaproteobacteria bacterium]|nr:manganese efflux pump [Deltaproteobacteria bacterium]